MKDIAQLEQEKENYQFWADGLIYDHQLELKYTLLRKANMINDEINELKNETSSSRLKNL